MDRSADLNRFYALLRNLEERVSRKRLVDCDGNMDWPRRGVYFFFEDGETRGGNSELRVVRVGTHAVHPGDQSTLWGRLRSHRGTLTGGHAGGGNHRGSVFRKHVGTAILRRNGQAELVERWCKGQSAERSVRDDEYPIELQVSQYIRAMPFLWLKVEDPPGPSSMRASIERNAIALLSNYGKLGPPEAIDAPSPMWLGTYCAKDAVRKSGPWNADHTNDNQWNQTFLDKLEHLIETV